MNFRQIKRLFLVNLLYGNPQSTQRARDKAAKTGKKGSIVRSLMMSYLASALILVVVFSMTLLPIDFPHFPGYFTFYCGVFTAMTFAQAITAIHNIFYESKDLKDYLPLPFSNVTLFASKFLAASYITAPFMLLLLALFVMTGFRSSGILGVLLGILTFVLYFGLFMLLTTWVVSLLVQTKLFQRYKKAATTLLMILPLVILVPVLMLYNQNAVSLDGHMHDRPVLAAFMPLYEILAKPISLAGALSFLGLLAVVAIFIGVLLKITIPQMFRLVLQENPAAKSGKASKKRKTKKAGQSRTLSQQLFHYNLGLIKNPTLWMQTLSASFLMPVIMATSSLSTGVFNLSRLSPKFFAGFVLVGAAFAFLSINPGSVVAVIISLDRENFDYIKSLPMNLRDYLQAKFRFVTGLQLILDGLVLLITLLILQLNLFLILGAIIGNLLTVYLLCLHYFQRDWRLLTLNWTTLSQLFTRGGGNFAMMFILLGGMLGAVLVCGLTFALLAFLPWPLAGNLIILLIAAGVFALLLTVFRQFWRRFN